MNIRRPVRQGFKPRTVKEYVVIRPFHITRDGERVLLQLGDSLHASELPLHILKLHWLRRRIEEKGSRYAEWAVYLQSVKYARAKGLTEADEGFPQAPDWIDAMYTEQRLAAAARVAHAPASTSKADSPVEGNKDLDHLVGVQAAKRFAKHVGGGTYEVVDGYSTYRVRGKAKVEELGIEVD